MTYWEILALFGSALAGGAINAVAGGGTLLTFPALLFTGTGAVVANATSSFALTLGTAGSLFGFRKQWANTRVWLWRFVPVSMVCSLLGSWLVRAQGEAVFVKVVPWLLLFATALFLAQGPLKRWREQRSRARNLTNTAIAGDFISNSSTDPNTGPSATIPSATIPSATIPSATILSATIPSDASPGDIVEASDPHKNSGPLTNRGGELSVAACIGLQAGVAVYGGYFGAGIGILMLAVLGFMGMDDIHRMNALKNLLAAVINGTAAVFFALSGLVDWPRMFIMLAGAVLGYWLGAHYSQKIPQAAVRSIVVTTGLVISLVMFWKMLR